MELGNEDVMLLVGGRIRCRPVRHILHCSQLSPPKRSTLQTNPIEPPDFFLRCLFALGAIKPF